MAEIVGMEWGEFLAEITFWNDDYIAKNPKVRPLEIEIQARANEYGCLSRDSIFEIMAWGGNPHNIGGQMRRNNTEDHVRRVTAEVMGVLEEPDTALDKITEIKWVGNSFGSKILAFLSPRTYGIWDSVVKQALQHTFNPPKTYAAFISLLRQTTQWISVTPNPHRLDASWFVRDVEQALFQFAWPKSRGGNGGLIIGTLPSY